MSQDYLLYTLESLSTTFLEAAKQNKNLGPFVNAYERLDLEKLQIDLQTDDEKKSFWINSYNAFTLLLLHKNGGSYGDRSSFFKDKHFTIAATAFSLDDMEHGILRRGKYKYSLGYFNKIWSPSWERKLWVKELDYRIHFALNCGANSCPPIKFYNSEKIQVQLDLASASYLEAEVEFDKKQNMVFLPAIFKWYAGDFGNTSEILFILKKYKILLPEVMPDISYKTYDWEVSAHPFGN